MEELSRTVGVSVQKPVLKSAYPYRNQMEKARNTILVVEDSAYDLDLLRFAMRNMACQFRFRSVSDGDEAIAYLKGEGTFSDRATNPFPDLLLLDLTLTKLDGFAVLEWLRNTTGSKGPQVIIWTGSNRPDYEQRAKALGAVRFFIKPSRIEDFKTMISKISLVLRNKTRCVWEGTRGLASGRS